MGRRGGWVGYQLNINYTLISVYLHVIIFIIFYSIDNNYVVKIINS